MKTTKKISLDIVIPFYNPEKDWEKTVSDKVSILQKNLSHISINAIMINDGSSINLTTGIEYVKANISNVSFLSNTKNMGKGFSIRKGLQIGKSHYSLFTDIDFPYEINNMIEMIDNLISNREDIIIGRRSEGYYNNQKSQRKIISKILQYFNKFILQIEQTDSQAGLKAFNEKGKIEFLNTKSNRFLADLEFLKSANKNNLKINSQFVKLRPDIKLPNMNIGNLFREIPSLIRIVLS